MLRRRAVGQHARAIEAQRVAVAARGLLGRTVEILAERSLEEIDGRRVEHVEPQHRRRRGVAVIVRRPVGGDEEIAARHEGLLALDRGIGALAVEHEAHRRGDVTVGRGDLARHDHLDAGVERVGDAQLAANAGIFQNEHAALGFFGGDQAARFQNQRLHVVVMPDRGHAAGHRLVRHQVAHDLPQRGHGVLGNAVVIGLPHRLDIVGRIAACPASSRSRRSWFLLKRIRHLLRRL